jgi:hypothetical protein
MDKECCKYIVAKRHYTFWLMVYEKDPNYGGSTARSLEKPTGLDRNETAQHVSPRHAC